MNNKSKGFTLIEMIGVIVIMGLIIIVVFPTLFKMVNTNQEEKYQKYYDVVKEAAETYSSTLTDKLGTSKYSGCAEVTLDTLIEKGYVEEYSDSSVTVSTGSGNIKIRNDYGSISINFTLSFTSGSDVYTDSSWVNDTDSCSSYSISVNNNIKTTLENASISRTTDGSTVYITGSSPKNYIWYSGKLWRVVSYNSSTETVKIVTVDALTSIYYNHNGVSTYSGSDVETWLNNDFLNSLKDSSEYIINSNWDATPSNTTNSYTSDSSKIKKMKVGLITSYEYGKIKSWYDDGSTASWVLSEGTSGDSLYTYNGTLNNTSSTSIHALRPVVTLSGDVLVYSGSGTSGDPYIIDDSDTAVGSSGDLINTRYSGEYVYVGDTDSYKKYRIVSVEDGKTKLISTFTVDSQVFSESEDNNTYLYSSSTLRTNLESSSFLTSVKSKLTTGNFCLDTINSTNLVYRSSACLTSDRLNSNIVVGIPKIGDLFSSGVSGKTYWTLNPNTETTDIYSSTMNVINSDGSTSALSISGTASARIVIYLDSSVKISGGKGTSGKPYTIS